MLFPGFECWRDDSSVGRFVRLLSVACIKLMVGAKNRKYTYTNECQNCDMPVPANFDCELSCPNKNIINIEPREPRKGALWVEWLWLNDLPIPPKQSINTNTKKITKAKLNKTIEDGGITVDFWIIKVHTSNWSSNNGDNRIAGDHQIAGIIE